MPSSVSDQANNSNEGLDDIEDIVTKNQPLELHGDRNRNNVIPRVKKSQIRQNTFTFNTDSTNHSNGSYVKTKDSYSTLQNGETEQRDSYVPGTQKIFLKTWGCSHNNSDSEYMAGQLAAYGYQITEDKGEADLWLLNSCTVKNPAEDHFRNSITAAKSQGKSVVLAGCVPQGQQKSDYIQGLSVVGVQQIDRVVEVVEETLKGNSVRLFGQKKKSGKKQGGASLNLPKIRKNPLIEIIAINTGCLNQCTYCKTKHARGDLGSYQPEHIVERARQSFEEGVVELWLTSEDLGAYGHDIGVTLPELLWKMVDVIPEGAMMRLGMTNPPYILEHLQQMSEILAHPSVYSFLHVPVQAGSDSVLMDMKREYCVADFKHVVDFLRDRVENVNIATDIICGFPTETDEDFKETMDLISQYEFASLFINQFFPRPGTPAYKMIRIPANEVKKRTKALSELFQSYHPYTNKVGEIHDILVTEISFDKKHFVGHNKSYDQVLVPMKEGYMGTRLRVEVTETGKHFMKGKVLKVLKKEISGLAVPFQKQKLSSPTSQPLFWIGATVLCAAVAWRVYRIATR